MNTNQTQDTGLGRLYRWFAHHQGKNFIDEEQALLQQQLELVFGYYLLQIGNFPPLKCDADSCKIKHHVVLGREQWQHQSQLRGDARALPIASESLDAVILPHILEFEDNPHQILREIDRCLVAEGMLIITAFNPISLWLPWRLLTGWTQVLPWNGRYLMQYRLRDWMELLGFDVLRVENFFYQPPFGSRFAKRLSWLDHILKRYLSWSGAGYILVAKKRVSTVTPIKPRWLLRPKPILGLGLGESINLHRENNDTNR